MTTFDEVRLPECIERGAQGGAGFNTTVLTLSSGFEKRNINWAEARASYDIGFGIRSKDDLSTLIAFFRARQGKARGFRFKDWSDFEMARQQIGVGDGSNKDFQIYKRYTSGSVNYDRDLVKIVDDTLSVWVNSTLKVDPGDYSVDLDTGIITFVTAPPNLQIVEATCEFDVPVRFDIDKLNVTMEMVTLGSVPSVSLVELKL